MRAAEVISSATGTVFTTPQGPKRFRIAVEAVGRGGGRGEVPGLVKTYLQYVDSLSPFFKRRFHTWCIV